MAHYRDDREYARYREAGLGPRAARVPTYDPRIGHGVRIVDGGGGDRGGFDRMGDFVSRRLLPTMLDRSERPLKVVMNFGRLHLDNERPRSPPPSPPRYHPRGGPSANTTTNAIIYNAPGSTMTLGRESRDVPVSHGNQYHGLARNVSPGRLPINERERRVDICLGCYKRQFVSSAGYCVECDYFLPASSPPPPPPVLSPPPRDRGYYSGGLDGVRYVQGVRSPGPLSRRELRDRHRERIEREREHMYSESYTDSELGFY
ncbi:hypothetical protein B0H63DRAFT_485701 [Podospora didyma]|uniref:Uncharacterized protein n=1 Tax=Podospora didyma TaxID=330526 RepID=A0AAE0N580_9PEZI|nr:hypothetical protein B0H63DRAFT_485701 [Podospora didyma]